MDREAWHATVHGATKSQTWLSDWTELNWKAESEEELKSLLMKVKEESEKSGLKFNIQKTKIMASGPILSWKIEGTKVAAVAYFVFMGYKITADGDCSHEMLVPWKKHYDQTRQHIKKQRHYFASKGPSSQSYGFSSSHVWMEKEIATHSSFLAWRIPWTEEPDRLQSLDGRSRTQLSNWAHLCMLRVGP